MLRALPLLALAACSGRDLLITPTSFAFGEVNMQVERPPDGYDARDLLLTNTGRGSVDIEFVGLDDIHLFLAAPIFASSTPPTLPALESGDTAIITVAPWDHALGELTTEVSGTFQVVVDGKDSTPITWSFTPVRRPIVDTASP